MGENLVIVESPAKAKTIEKILGKNFTVRSSFGHIRDLAKKNLGINIEDGFEPVYEISAEKKKVVADLKSEVDKASVVWLASDEDREGEAIAWHLRETLSLDAQKTKRIVFHEITKDAVLHAIENPRDVDMNLVMAQQARRVLDRLVGFELSPILWKKIKPSLSAGRVQSVALRLVVEKEREIAEFKPKLYYKVEGNFHPVSARKGVKMHGTLNTRIESKDAAMEFLEKCRQSDFSIANVEKKEVTRVPAAPFTTSSLQQEASRKCGFSVSQTMSLAQKLYEAGYITYMRTDSTTLSKLAISTAKEWIVSNYGSEYHHARQYKTNTKGAQEAHEAIRPTYISNTDIAGTAAEKRLYQLIWKRTVASQMADAKMEKTEVSIGGSRFSEYFIASGNVVLFDGFLALYTESKDDDTDSDDEKLLPAIKEGDSVERLSVLASEKYTSSPARYSEATLVKKMEDLGIGRPSTYAPTISTLGQRGYVSKQDKPGMERVVEQMTLEADEIKILKKKESFGSEKGRICPEDIGMVVTSFLEDSFPQIMDYGFTAKVEADFDKVANGKLLWNKIIENFYKPFHKKVEEETQDNSHLKARRVLGTDPVTGKVVIARMGKFGSVAQIGEDDDPEKRITGLEKGQLIESVTLEQALKLFGLPRTLGEYKGMNVSCSKGRFGPYVKCGDMYVSLKKGMDLYAVTLQEAIPLIEEHIDKQNNKDIKSFPEADIAVLNGRFGPYIKHAGENYKIAKGTDPATLTLEDCQAIIAAGPVKKSVKTTAKKAPAKTAKKTTKAKATKK